MTSDIPRVNVLGVNVAAINMGMALETMESWIKCREAHYVCVTGVHGVIESQRDPSLLQIHNQAGMVTPDGMPLVWLSRLHGHKHADRVYGPDLMLRCCDWSVRNGYRHFFFGGNAGVPEVLAERLKRKIPGLQITGTHSPPFGPVTPEEDEAIVRRINESAPDIVWVGLSTPKQEKWMHEHLGRVRAPVMIGVGAAFDFNAGLKRQAPHWMQRAGLEWLFRLVTEPRRLWRRYAFSIPVFLWNICLQATGARRFDVSPARAAARMDILERHR